MPRSHCERDFFILIYIFCWCSIGCRVADSLIAAAWLFMLGVHLKGLAIGPAPLQWEEPPAAEVKRHQPRLGVPLVVVLESQ